MTEIFVAGGNKLELKIVTGMSGAGKTQVIQILEDLGFYCVDNLPPNLFVKFAELAEQSNSGLNKVALVADVRGGRFFLDLINVMEDMKASGLSFEIIFLEASVTFRVLFFLSACPELGDGTHNGASN